MWRLLLQSLTHTRLTDTGPHGVVPDLAGTTRDSVAVDARRERVAGVTAHRQVRVDDGARCTQ